MKNIYLLEISANYVTIKKAFKKLSEACKYGANYVMTHNDFLFKQDDSFEDLFNELLKEWYLRRGRKDSLTNLIVTITEVDLS